MLTLYLSYNPVDGGHDHEVWKGVDTALRQSWNSSIDLRSLPSGLTAPISSPLVPLAMLKEASLVISEKFGPQARAQHPMTMIIDTEKPESVASRIEGQYKRFLRPWELYASRSAFEDLRFELDRSADLVFDENPDSRYGRLLLDEDDHFLYAKALIRGEGVPCFYCGGRNHRPVECPSKQLFPTKEGLETLGRHSLSQMNNCFLRYLTSPRSKTGFLSDNPYSFSRDDPMSLAHLAYYDIKRVFQLRFFRLFFGTDRLDWEKIRQSKDQPSQGGPTWLALDCLRVGDLERAKQYVETGIERNPLDWKSTCTLGFLHIENGNLSNAEDCFEKALDQSRRVPQRILLNLLLSRVNRLNREPQLARKYARSALLMDRWCYDALYQMIVLDFELAKNGEPLQALERLAKQNGYYWVCAAIDPDLAAFSDDIHPSLARIAAEGRHEADIAYREAQRRFKGIQTLLGGVNSKILREAEGVASALDSMSSQEGYVNSRERLREARVLKALCEQALDEQKQELRKTLEDLKALIDEVKLVAGTVVEGNAGRPSLEPFYTLSKKVEQARGNVTLDFSNTYRDIMENREEYVALLKETIQALKSWRRKKQLGSFSLQFLTRISVLLSVTFALSLLFPFLIAGFETLVPQFRISSDGYGFLRQIFIILGSLGSLAIAAFSSYSKTYGTRGRKEPATSREVQLGPASRQVKAGRA